MAVSWGSRVSDSFSFLTIASYSLLVQDGDDDKLAKMKARVTESYAQLTEAQQEILNMKVVYVMCRGAKDCGRVH